MTSLPLITASLIFIAGVIDDLRSRKFHNWLFLASTGLGFAVMALVAGTSGVLGAMSGFVVGAAILLPLVLAKIVGAGDMKLMAAAGTLLGWSTVIDVAIYSLIWGALFGLLQVVLKRQLRATMGNMISILNRKPRTELTGLHSMPFTVALLLGWLTALARAGVL